MCPTSKFSTFAGKMFVAIAAATACGLLTGSPAGAQIKIGVQAPLTGFAATDGKSSKIAADMAIEEINNAGGELGQKLELIAYTIRQNLTRRSSPPTS